MAHGKIVSLALAGTLVFAGCGGSEQAADTEAGAGAAAQQASDRADIENPHEGMQMPGSDGSMHLTFKCGNDESFDLVLKAGTSMADLVVGEETYELAAEKVASGMRYSDGTWTFHGKGLEAFVTKGEEEVFSGCRAAGHR